MDRPKNVIVTGASRGVGAAAALWLGKLGCSVCLVARTAAGLEQTADKVERLGGQALTILADIADVERCRNIVETAVAQFGNLDGIINNAGIAEPLAKVSGADPSQWRYNFDVNVMGPFYLIHAALDRLKNTKGRIVNVSSGAATHVIEAASAYCAAKAALTQFTRVLAAEEPEITSVSVRPGVVDTQMQMFLRREGPRVMPPDTANYYQNLKRRGALEPTEVPGRAIAWLALFAPNQWSGRFLDYDDPEIAEPAVNVFGNEY